MGLTLRLRLQLGVRQAHTKWIHLDLFNKLRLPRAFTLTLRPSCHARNWSDFIVSGFGIWCWRRRRLHGRSKQQQTVLFDVKPNPIRADCDGIFFVRSGIGVENPGRHEDGTNQRYTLRDEEGIDPLVIEFLSRKN